MKKSCSATLAVDKAMKHVFLKDIAYCAADPQQGICLYVDNPDVQATGIPDLIIYDGILEKIPDKLKEYELLYWHVAGKNDDVISMEISEPREENAHEKPKTIALKTICEKEADMGAAFRITDCRGNVIFISKIVKEGDCRTCSKPDATRWCGVKNWRMRSGEMQICIYH